MTIRSFLGCEGYGCEPLFSPGYIKTIMDGTELPELSELLVEIAKREGFYSDELMLKIGRTGTANHLEVPEKWRAVFAGANEIHYSDHIKMMATLQEHVDAGISKTINMSSNATIEDVRNAYMQVYESGVIKGITVYRDGSRDSAPISLGMEKKETVPTANRVIEPRPRPTTTVGITTQVKTGCGKMYITINKDDNGICETFAKTGSSGGCAGLTEGVSRLISLLLRVGVDPKYIVDQLCSVECKVSINKAGALGKSCPDAIGKVLRETLGIDPKKSTKAVKELGIDKAIAMLGESHTCSECNECASLVGEAIEEIVQNENTKNICELCGQPMVRAEGCWTCSCGNGKCG